MNSSHIFSLDNLIQGFLLSCQIEAMSPKTVESYRSFLFRFRRFLAAKNYPLDVKLIDKNHIRAFIRYLQTEARTPHKNQPLSPVTVQDYARTLKTFYSWLWREEYLDSNPMLKIALPKAPTKVISTFTNEHIAKLLDLCRDSNHTGHRNMTILLLLLDTGIRVSELIGIDLDDVNIYEGYIRIRQAKGGKERVIPLGSLVQKAIWKYINNYRATPPTAQITNLFLCRDGLPLSRNGVQQILRRYAQRAGITGVKCSPHTCRHTFAKTYLLNGGDIFSLQKILGHSCLASVRNYVNLFAIDVKRQHQRFSPIDNMTQCSGMQRVMHYTIRRNKRR